MNTVVVVVVLLFSSLYTIFCWELSFPCCRHTGKIHLSKHAATLVTFMSMENEGER